MKTLKQWLLPLIFITVVPAVLAAEDDIRDHPGYVDEIAESMTVIAAEMDADGWERVIRVRDGEDHVDVYFRLSEDAEIIYGITIMVAEPGDTVLVNIVGEISIDDISALGRRFNIDELVDIQLSADDDADQDNGADQN